MRIVITGHRTEKLQTYNIDWINSTISDILIEIQNLSDKNIAYSGMASGVDLFFCSACRILDIPYIACIPFEGQETKMTQIDCDTRKTLLEYAKEIKHVKNSWMVEHCDIGIVVWDGNKGGTHNVIQQFVENKIDFFWINPVAKVVWKCFI
jgi:uncharacterized phage-like protein YoqJ